MNYEQLIELKKRKHEAVKLLYKKFLLDVKEYANENFDEYYFHRCMELISNEYLCPGLPTYDMFNKCLLTEREHNEHLGYKQGGSAEQYNKESRTPLEKELFKLYKNDESFTGVNGAEQLLSDLQEYAKQMCEKMPNNKVCKMLYATLMDNDELLPNVKNDIDEIISNIKVSKQNSVDIENRFFKTNCVKLDISNMSKLKLEILEYVLKYKISELNEAKMWTRPTYKYSREKWDGEYYTEETQISGDWDTYNKLENNISAHEEKLKEVRKKLKELNHKETETEKE